MTTLALLLATFTLVGPDRQATVLLPTNAGPGSVFAASELTNYVCRMTGKALSVGSRVPRDRDGRAGRAPLPGGDVVIGTVETLGDDVPAAAKEALSKAKDDEAFWIGTDAGSLWIVGLKNSGELRGTYRFIEKYLGVRWFKEEIDGDPGDYVPQLKTIELADFAEFREPYFMIRRMDQTGSWGWPFRAISWVYRLGFQAPPGYGGRVPFERPDWKDKHYRLYAPRTVPEWNPHGGGHCTIMDYINPDKEFDRHPEYFALVDGKRRKDCCYCLSNPDVIRLTAEGIIARMQKHDGGRGDFHFGQWDVSHGFCQCANCRKLADKDAKSSDDISNIFNLFVREVAKRVYAACPEANLQIWVYSTYRRYTGIEQDPRMMVYFCTHGRCHAHTLDDPSCSDNVAMLRNIEDWHSPGRKIFFYDYLTCTPNLYTPNEVIEAQDIRFYAKQGYVGWKNEAVFGDAERADKSHPDDMSTCWQWLYVTGHLLWDPTEDWEKLLADAESKYYGPAYPAMKKYHAERRRLWAKPGPCVGYPRGDSRRPTLLAEPRAKEKLLGFLAEAEKLASGDALRLLRVRQDRAWLTKYWIKPNERLREEEARAVRLAATKNLKIAIDGVGDEEAWKTASVQTNFTSTTHAENKTGWAMAGKLATEVKILRDEKNFYLLCTAMEPSIAKIKCCDEHDGPVWEDDHFEFMFAPPVIDCRYYQVCVNAKGTVFDASWPGGKDADDFGVEAKGRVLADRWIVEMRIPVEKMHEFVPGEKWRVLFGRLRSILDEHLPHHWNSTCSVGGAAYHDTSNFSVVEIVK